MYFSLIYLHFGFQSFSEEWDGGVFPWWWWWWWWGSCEFFLGVGWGWGGGGGARRGESFINIFVLLLPM